MTQREKPLPEQGPDRPTLDVVMGERRHLVNLAYRMLGSLAEAEDAVQETYTRWYGMTAEEQRAIESPGGWLTRVASRICLDVLRSARSRRERYVGEWLPEPVPGRSGWLDGQRDDPTADPADPADRVTLDESITMAFLVVLESMTPAQRVAFVLHDVFRYPFDDVAEIVGRTPAACRRLASSARNRVRTAERPAAPEPEQAAVVRRFKEAWAAKDVAALVALLDPGVTATADGGGRVSAVLEPIHGGEPVARALVGVAELAPGLTLVERPVNGRPGLVAQVGGTVETVLAFEVTADRITRIWAVRNPEKLRPWMG
jgi:RNA polymerase sigma factor (sigma-70 family)